jgi:hypothetical protein
MAFIVVYDANVLYPNTLRDLLIRISQVGLVQAKWANGILDEMLRALRPPTSGSGTSRPSRPMTSYWRRTGGHRVPSAADSRTRPPQDIEDVLSQLERDGLAESIAALRAG